MVRETVDEGVGNVDDGVLNHALVEVIQEQGSKRVGAVIDHGRLEIGVLVEDENCDMQENVYRTQLRQPIYLDGSVESSGEMRLEKLHERAARHGAREIVNAPSGDNCCLVGT